MLVITVGTAAERERPRVYVPVRACVRVAVGTDDKYCHDDAKGFFSGRERVIAHDGRKWNKKM